jgi:hypothetical protein
MNEWFKNHSTLAITVATVIGYGVGYSNVALFARELGVSVGDLDADLRDYLLLAGINVATWTLAIALLMGLARIADMLPPSDGPPRRNVALGIVVSIEAATLVLLTYAVVYVSVEPNVAAAVDRISNNVAYFVLAVIIVIAFPTIPSLRRSYVEHELRERLQASGLQDDTQLRRMMSQELTNWWQVREPIVIVGWIGLIVMASTVVTLIGAVKWASDIEKWGEGEAEPSGPIGLALILQPELGEAYIGTSDEPKCAVRVSERVLAGKSVLVTDAT